MNTRQLKTFCAVVRAGSFSKATEHEYISSSALIQQIQTLEKEIGCALLNRSPTGVRLTNAGKLFFDTACSVLAQLDEAAIRCQQISYEEERTLYVGSFDNNLLTYSPYALRTFQKEHPDIRIKLVSTTLSHAPGDLRDGKIDVCEYVFCEEIEKSGLSFSAFYACPRSGFVARDNPLASKAVLTREDLKNKKVALHNFLWCPDLVAWFREEPSIDLIELPCTTDAVYNLCLNDGVYLLPGDCTDKYPVLTTIPLAYSFCSQYGFAYRKECKPIVHEFLQTLKNASVPSI